MIMWTATAPTAMLVTVAIEVRPQLARRERAGRQNPEQFQGWNATKIAAMLQSAMRSRVQTQTSSGSA